MVDPSLVTTVVGAAGTAAGALFGWLTGRRRTDAAIDRDQAEARAADALAEAHEADAQESLSATVAALSTQVRDLWQRQIDLAVENAALREQLAAAQAQITQLSTRIDQHDEIERRLAAENAELREQLAQARAQLATAQAEVERLRASIGAATQPIRR